MATKAKAKTKAKAPETPQASMPVPAAPTPAETQIWPAIPSRLEIAEKCAPLEGRIKEVETKAAEYKTVETEEVAEAALTYVDYIRKSEQSIEKRRRMYVDPPNEFVKTLNAIVKGYSTRLESTRRELSQKILGYQNAKAERLRKEADEKRKKEEQEAKQRADALKAQGKADEAQKLMEIAATAPAAKTDVRIRAADGPTSVVTTLWKGQIVSMKEFMKAVIEGKLDEYIYADQHITVQAIPLNSFAKANQASEGQVIHGIKIVKDQSLSSR